MMDRTMEVLEEVVEKCRTVLGENLTSIVLFGSVARGLEDSRSDIDLLIVVDRDAESDLLKDIRIEMLLKYSVKLDMILMGKQDVTDNFEHFSPLFLSFVLGVSVLVDDDFFEREYFKFLNKLKEENIKYVEGGKVWDLREISSGILQ
ncbi:MAG: nucleotidyltransferase domain-containing protein [Theionarchaea archaeon]|nr:nucleotidyltransferase domain-containing protein [Theionarchaea archaeon]